MSVWQSANIFSILMISTITSQTSITCPDHRPSCCTRGVVTYRQARPRSPFAVAVSQPYIEQSIIQIFVLNKYICYKHYLEYNFMHEFSSSLDSFLFWLVINQIKIFLVRKWHVLFVCILFDVIVLAVQHYNVSNRNF